MERKELCVEPRLTNGFTSSYKDYQEAIPQSLQVLEKEDHQDSDYFRD